jgi:cytosine/adenosine deaminase-related metal-dependent hydrolase
MSAQLIRAGLAYLDGAFVPDAAVAVEGARITAAGAFATLRAQYPDAAVSGDASLLLLPGLINSHDHGRALGTVALGVPDSFLEVWLTSLGTLPVIPPELAAAYEGWQLIRGGVTATAHSHNPAAWETLFDELPGTLAGYAQAGVRVALHPPIIDQNRLVYWDAARFVASLPPHLRAAAAGMLEPLPLSADSYFAALDELFARWHDPQQHRVHIQVSPAGGQWCSDALIQRAADWARARHTRIQMHMLETRYQRAYALRAWDKGFVAHLDDLGVLDDRLTLAHMVWIEAEDVPLLAERGVGVAHNPSSNLRLRSGIAPLARLHAAGVRLGVGLDGHTLDDDQDYLRELRLAYTLSNTPNASAPDLPALAILHMATAGGAAITFGVDAPLGRLAPGCLADLVLLDWDAVRGPWCPDGHPDLAHTPEFLLRRAQRTHVRHVMVGGEWRLRDGQPTGLNPDDLHAQMRACLQDQLTPASRELAALIRQFYAQTDEEL